jgi:flagellin
MSSIMTNTSAMTALRSLAMTNKAIETTQTRISTGYAVAEAADNAAYWSIATTMRSDNSALATVQDALGLGAAKVDVAYTGLNSAIDVVDEIKSKLVASREPGVDKAKIQSEIAELQNQLVSITESASFSGENWLSVDSSGTYSATKSVVSSFNRATDGTVSVSTIDIDITSTELFDAADQTGMLDSVAGFGALSVSVSTLDVSAALRQILTP